MVWLVAPGLRFHSATDKLLKYLSPEIHITRIGLNEKLAAWDRSDFSAVMQFRRLGVRGKTIPNFQGRKIREAA